MEQRPTRKPNRLKGFDYSLIGDYFITFCVKNRKNIFWKSDYKTIETKEYKDLLNANGIIAAKIIDRVNSEYVNKIRIEKYVIMPDHVHLLFYVYIDNVVSVDQFIRMIKRQISIEIGMKEMWQKGYFDHIIRNEKDYDETWEYIDANPRKLTGNMYMK